MHYDPILRFLYNLLFSVLSLNHKLKNSLPWDAIKKSPFLMETWEFEPQK